MVKNFIHKFFSQAPVKTKVNQGFFSRMSSAVETARKEHHRVCILIPFVTSPEYILHFYNELPFLKCDLNYSLRSKFM